MLKKLIYFSFALCLLLAIGVFLYYKTDGKITGRDTHNKSIATMQALSSSSNEVECFVVNYKSESIAVFDGNSSGNIAPLRTINNNSSASNGMSKPGGIALDRKRREILVASEGNNSILIYDINASGDQAPKRIIAGLLTKLDRPVSIAVDDVNNEIFIANRGSDAITVYPRDAADNITPIRVIAGKATKLIGPESVAFDKRRNELYVLNQDYGRQKCNVIIFDRMANGDTEPKRLLSATEVTTEGYTELNRLIIDEDSDSILVLTTRVELPDYGESYISVYHNPPSKDGYIGAYKTLILQQASFDGFAVDNDEIYLVANGIYVYKRGQDYNAKPVRIIHGPATALSYPAGIVVYRK